MTIQRLAYDIKPDILPGMSLGDQLLVACIAVGREVGKINGILQLKKGLAFYKIDACAYPLPCKAFA